MEEQNQQSQQQPTPQPKKPKKKFYKKWWFWVATIVVVAILVFYFIPTTRIYLVGDFVKLGEVNVNINDTFPNPPCSSCNLGIEPTQEFGNMKSDNKQCESNNDCVVLSYSSNPASQCGFTTVPINKSGREIIQSEMDMYFEAFEAGEPVGVCGMPIVSPVGVKCVKSECKMILKDNFNGNYFIDK